MDKFILVLKVDYTKHHKDLYKGAIIEVIYNRGKYISLDYNVIIDYNDVAHLESDFGKAHRNEKDYIIYKLRQQIEDLKALCK